MGQTTQNSKVIKAKAETIYEAFSNPQALEVWQAPGDMTAKIHNFDFCVDGGYEMSLYYPDSETEMKGKTEKFEDRFSARFVELIPNEKIVEAVSFKSPNPDFSGEMIVEITFEPTENGTNVTYFFKNIPKGIRSEDNEAGTISTLNKLAKYVEN
ncbi:MAG: SRPBCC domain-containing protein [Vicingaceae bacterium]